MVSKVKKVRDECVKDLKRISGYELMMRAVKFSNDVKKLIDNTNLPPAVIVGVLQSQIYNVQRTVEFISELEVMELLKRRKEVMNKMVVNKKEIKIEEIIELGNDFSKPLISELEGKEIVITNVRFDSSKYGEYAVITTDDGKQYRTSGMVLLKQLRELQKYLEKYKVRAKVKKIKNYYILE